MSEIIFVSLGAILGANTRFKLHTELQKLNLKKGFSILIINIFASFCLGFLLSIIGKFTSFIYYYQLVLFFLIGFLGSLSTFSSFVYDLFDLCLQLKIRRVLGLFVISSSMGIIAFAFGSLLGKQ